MNKKKNKVSNVMLVIIVAAIIIYTIANFWLQYVANIEVSPTLTTAWFSFWGVELLSLAGIKISKVFNGESDNIEDDQQ